MKIQRKKGIAGALALVVALGSFLPAVPAYAVEGWTKSGDSWSYLNRADQPVTNMWKKSKESWYFLGEDGTIVTDRIFSWQGYDYFVDAEGKMLTDAWVWINADNAGATGYEEGWHYFGADGKGYKGKNRSFRKEIGGKRYAFDENGAMLVGWIDEDGEVVDDADPFVEGLYYAGADGALYTNQWLNFGEIGGTDGVGGSSLESTVSGRSYEDYPEMWVYFGADSKKYRSGDTDPLQKVIGGETYGFDENGVMLAWWSRVASISDAMRSNPTSSESAKYYSGYDGGPLMKNRWLWMYPSENLSAEDHIDLESSWWRTDTRGRVYRNQIRNVNGRRYIFDGIGRMQTGFVLFNSERSEGAGGVEPLEKGFVAQYDVDAWSSEDFIEGNLYGIERADLYFCSADELNDGSIQTGKELQIELADGVFTFGFAPNGKAYGNRNGAKVSAEELGNPEKKDGKYYINGLRLNAKDGYPYGVVKTLRNGSDYYQVVDARGKVVTGRRVLRDGDGGFLLIANGRFLAWCGDEDAPKWRNGAEGPGFYHYDKSNKADHYAGGLIAGSGTDTDESGLPDELSLNF